MDYLVPYFRINIDVASLLIPLNPTEVSAVDRVAMALHCDGPLKCFFSHV